MPGMFNTPPGIIASVGPVLHDVVKKGFQCYPNNYGPYALDHSATSRACLIHDHIIALGKEMLPAQGFYSTKHMGRSVFTYQDVMVVQFKRLDHRLMPQNFETKLSKSLYQDGVIDGLEGILTELPFVTVGYIPDELWLNPMGIYATQIVNQRPEWTVRLDEGGIAQDELPISPTPNEPQRPSTARIKTSLVRRGDDSFDPINVPERNRETRAS